MKKMPRGTPFKRPQDYAILRPQELFVVVVLGWMLIMMIGRVMGAV